jgi:hypothetical protein
MGLKAIKLFKVTIILIMLTLWIAVSADSVWDGSVSTARYGYLPETGLYAASNAFPKDSVVRVTNPETGKSVDVTILERLDDNNLFLVLSSEAAESVGIAFGDVFSGNITEQNNINTGAEEELPYNPDPDVNPSAEGADYSELALIQDYIDNELGGSDDTLLESDVSDPIEEEEIPVEIMSDPEIPVETDPPIIIDTVPLIVDDIEASEDIQSETDTGEVLETAEENTDPPVFEPAVEEIIEEEPIAEPVEISEVEEIIEEDIPSVENMPMEEVYIAQADENLLPPELVILSENSPADIVETELIQEVDIPKIISMSANAPLLIELADVRGVLPKLPVPESDIPVVSSMNLDLKEESLASISILELPELPIIGVEEVIIDEIPVAVSMAADIMPVEELEEIYPDLPGLIQTERAVDIPIVVAISTENPVEDPLEELVEFEPQIIVPEEEIVTPELVLTEELQETVETIVEEDIAVTEELNIPDEITMEVEIVLEPSDLRPPVVEIAVEEPVEQLVEDPIESDPVELVLVEDPIESDPVELVLVESETIEETAEEPTSTDPVEVTEAVELTADTEKYNVTRVLSEDSYYLQLGVYREQYSALNLADHLGGTYPVTVLVSEGNNTPNYKVMVGPLGQDESGAVLYSFQSRGYPDAFLRIGL